MQHADLASMDVVALCGGRGTRLGALTATMPKPLLPINGTPFLLTRLLELAREGFARFHVAAHYLAEQFEAFAVTYAAQVPQVRILREPEPLGTGGALRHASLQVSSGTIVALNGDSWLPQPLAPVVRQHQSAGRDLTMVVVDAENVAGGAQDKDAVVIGPQDTIRGFTRSPARSGARWINAGLYVLERRAVLAWPAGAYGLEPRLLSMMAPERTQVYYSRASLLDIGTPDAYAQASDVVRHSTILTRN